MLEPPFGLSPLIGIIASVTNVFALALVFSLLILHLLYEICICTYATMTGSKKKKEAYAEKVVEEANRRRLAINFFRSSVR